MRFAAKSCLLLLLISAIASGAQLESTEREVDAQTLRLTNEQVRFETAQSGDFVADVDAGSERRFATALQTSTITSDSLGTIRALGMGSASSARTGTAGASENTFARSALEVVATATDDSIISIAGQLSSPPEVALTGEWLYDRSFAEVVLRDRATDVTLWSTTMDGAFQFSQQVPAGTYEFSIEAVAEIKSLSVYDKTVAWDTTFEIRSVPEPTSGILLSLCIVVGLFRSRISSAL